MFPNITGLKKAEESVRRLGTIMQDSDDAIAVVDYNVDFTESLQKVLELNRHLVRVVHDGNSAIDMAKQMLPEVILLDLGSPGMNGYETVQQLRTLPQLQNALMIAVSWYVQEEDRVRARTAGFNDHLKKPIDMQQILEMIWSK